MFDFKNGYFHLIVKLAPPTAADENHARRSSRNQEECHARFGDGGERCAVDVEIETKMALGNLGGFGVDAKISQVLGGTTLYVGHATEDRISDKDDNLIVAE